MSVATRNPFALLDDDAPSAPAPVQKEETPAPAAAPARGAANQKSRGGPASRGGKYYSRGGKPSSKDATPVTEETEGQKKFDGPAREGGRGRGGRGRGGARGGRGRAYDRHSQTGKTDSDKKLHQGWGGDDGNTELKAESAAVVDAVAESAANEWDAPASADAWANTAAPENAVDAWASNVEAGAPDAEGKPERQRKEREPEEEDNTLTLDQYLAKKQESAVIPKLEGTRKANDGAEDVFKDAVPLTKNEEEDAYFVGKTKSAPKPRAKKEEKVYLEIDARFERPDRGGRGRGRGGDRGGDRGGEKRGARGRGGPRGGRQNNGAPAVNVDDQTAFPSLS
ncbi:hypothetical protein D9613_001846 [Agrocybe pediades]|uniref:Hyaluronan/mRNA-binding protein domain-containing protein n=1 Tax=Agrocybe pediades TaxID=84607 RepID=A0A8H4VWU5_9AGAR|nr:hypothetical protein D9613_001846 [Agrocybe pediades]